MEASNKPEYECASCGAKLEYAPGVQALKCPYCGTKVEIGSSGAKPMATPGDARFIVPMTIDHGKFKNAAYRYMFSQEDAPDDIIDYSTFTKNKLRYVPCYIYDGKFQASWTASFGYDRTETYVVDGKLRSRVVTDWRPASGQDFGVFKVISYAGGEVPGYVVGMVERTAGIDNMRPFDPAYVINAETGEFAATADEAFERDGSKKVEAVIEGSIMKYAQGDRQRDWQWSSNIQRESYPVLMPVGEITFEYKGSEYTVWCDGMDDSNFAGDALPVDTERKKKLMLGHIPWVGTVIGAIAGYFLFKETFNWIVFAAPVAAMVVYMLARNASIKVYSRKLKQRSLTNYQISNNISTEDAQSISENLKAPSKPLLLSLAAYDMVILPVLALACFGISCALQNAFPHKAEKRAAHPAAAARPSSAVTPAAAPAAGNAVSVSTANPVAGQGQAAATATADEVRTASAAAQKANRQFNQDFKAFMKRVPAAQRQEVAADVQRAFSRMNESCRSGIEGMQGDANAKKAEYLVCMTLGMENLSSQMRSGSGW